jgi:hypothetical protein
MTVYGSACGHDRRSNPPARAGAYAVDIIALEDSAEPLQRLPVGMPRRYAEHKPVDSDVSAPPPTNVGGYDELLNFPSKRSRCRGRTLALPPFDDLIDGACDKDSPQGFPPIGVFYGDVLTHTHTGAHREVIEDGYPLCRPDGFGCVTITTVQDILGLGI